MQKKRCGLYFIYKNSRKVGGMFMNLPKIRDYLSIYKYNNKVGIGDSVDTALEIEDIDGIFYRFIKLCDGSRTIDEIYTSLKSKNNYLTLEDINSWIAELDKAGYVLEDESDNIEFLSNPENERHLRNLNFLSNFSSDNSGKFKYMNVLKNQNILLIGLGGVGSVILYNLAALGVKKILGIDFDIVDKTNLNRQILYSESDVGKKKTIASKDAISNFNSDIFYTTLDMKINSYEELDMIVKSNNFTFIFCAADSPPITLYRWVDKVANKFKIPWMYGGTREATSSYSLIIPNYTKGYAEAIESILKKSNKEAREKYRYAEKSKMKAKNNCIAASSSILSSFMVFDFIKYVTNMHVPLSNNSIIYFDYRSMNIKEVKL